jgi:hypothetical protein
MEREPCRLKKSVNLVYISLSRFLFLVAPVLFAATLYMYTAQSQRQMITESAGFLLVRCTEFVMILAEGKQENTERISVLILTTSSAINRIWPLLGNKM